MNSTVVTRAGPLFTSPEWTPELIERTYGEIEKIALGELGLNIYPNEIHIITFEQMLDAYASNGLPISYRHWSFGKRFVQYENAYRAGRMGLAYEIVINTNPCQNFLMEDNSMTMQTLVLAHAAFGHNHFFKNNSSFTQWTDPSGIMDYLSFAKRFIAGCEERYGVAAVESILDSAHALQNIGVDRVKRRRARSFRKEEERLEERMRERERTFNDLWRTVPGTRTEQATPMDERKRLLGLPEENILYFIEKHAPKLKSWEREVIRIVRNIGQYFYPQRYVKTMNEGCATWVHYTILNRMHSRGLITDSSMFEFLQSHTNVVFQPNFDDVRYSGFNPYALGFAIMRDIERIAERPTPEDRRWFPDFAGQGKGIEVLRNAWANYRDESFILQFLSPNVMRDFKMFHLLDHESNETFVVGDIHDDEGYRNVRRALSRLYDPSHTVPSIEITDMDVDGSRALTLTHHIKDGIRLDEDATLDVLLHIQELWGYDVEILEVTEDGEVIARID